jgi:hypothetical protein
VSILSAVRFDRRNDPGRSLAAGITPSADPNSTARWMSQKTNRPGR